VWREPEVVVRSDEDGVAQAASGCAMGVLADAAWFETPISDSFWLFRPRMNGYNVHDGVSEEPGQAD
jgi:hypothetical protein